MMNKPMYHETRCETCIDNANRLYLVRQLRNGIYAKRRRNRRNFNISRIERHAKWDSYDNTVEDLNATIRMIVRAQAEHIEGARIAQ